MITLRTYWICLVEKVKFIAHTIGAYHRITLICTSVYMKMVGGNKEGLIFTSVYKEIVGAW